jgi:hypothetical protein
VSYHLRRGAGGMSGQVASPAPVTMMLPLEGQVESAIVVEVDGKAVESHMVAQGDGRRIVFELPAGEHKFRTA